MPVGINCEPWVMQQTYFIICLMLLLVQGIESLSLISTIIYKEGVQMIMVLLIFVYILMSIMCIHVLPNYQSFQICLVEKLWLLIAFFLVLVNIDDFTLRDFLGIRDKYDIAFEVVFNSIYNLISLSVNVNCRTKSLKTRRWKEILVNLIVFRGKVNSGGRK